MQTLEELIRDAAARGELNHLSLIGDHKRPFTACFRVASTTSHTFGEDADPVEALKKALAGAKMVRKPRAPVTVRDDDDDLEFG